MINNILNFLIQNGIYGIILGALSEAVFMPFPMEVLYVPIMLANPTKAFFYALVLISFSTVGSSIGYVIGKFFGRKVLFKFGLISSVALSKIENLYNKSLFTAVLTSAFTPIPYEAYTLSAGIFKVNFIKFASAALLSRVLRYLPQGILISLYGEKVASSLRNYGFIIGITAFILLLLIKYILKRLGLSFYKSQE